MENKVSLDVSPFGIKFLCRIKDIEKEKVEFKNEDGSVRHAQRYNLQLESVWGELLATVYYDGELVKGGFVNLRLDKYEKKVGKAADYRFSVIS